MSADDWMNDNPEATDQVYNTITRRMFMKDFRDLHPIANEFQRKIVIDMAHDIISIVLEDK